MTNHEPTLFENDWAYTTEDLKQAWDEFFADWELEPDPEDFDLE